MKKFIYPIVFGLLILIAGIFVSEAYNLYYLIPPIDKLYHFLGGFALAWLFYSYLAADIFNFSKFKRILAIVSIVCLIGVFWEYAERLSTIYSPQHLPVLYHWFHGGDLNDTLLYILADITGGLFFAIFI